MHVKLPNLSHWEGNIVIEECFNYDSIYYTKSAVNNSYWKSQNGPDIFSMGKHYDKFVFVNGLWKFYKRNTTFIWTQSEGFIIDKLF